MRSTGPPAHPVQARLAFADDPGSHGFRREAERLTDLRPGREARVPVGVGGDQQGSGRVRGENDEWPMVGGQRGRRKDGRGAHHALDSRGALRVAERGFDRVSTVRRARADQGEQRSRERGVGGSHGAAQNNVRSWARSCAISAKQTPGAEAGGYRTQHAARCTRLGSRCASPRRDGGDGRNRPHDVLDGDRLRQQTGGPELQRRLQDGVFGEGGHQDDRDVPARQA